MDPHLLTPVLVVALIVWGIFRRLRRTFGRQRVDPGRMWFRVGLLTLITVMLLVGIGANARILEGFVAGAACGIALGVIGLRHTQFEVTPQGRFYTPHAYIGLAVAALFLGRLLYRYFYMFYVLHGTVGGNPNLALAYERNPLTLATFGAVVGYYASYYLGILARTRTSALPVDAKPSE